MAIGATVVLAIGISVASARPGQPRAGVQQPASDQLLRDAAAAADEFRVPRPVLLAVSYALTGWQHADGRPTGTGGRGLMHLTDGARPGPDGRGDGRVPPADAVAADEALHTLRAAAELVHVPDERLAADARQNLRGGAALLAHYAAAATGGPLPTSIVGWYGAIARYGAGGDAMTGRSFADDVFAVLRRGVPATEVDGQRLALDPVADAAVPRGPGTGRGLPGQVTTECPAGLDCRFVPAAYAALDPDDATAYGNSDPADRPATLPISSIVVGRAPGTYAATVAAAQRPASYQSTHYVVRAVDGQVTQLVRTADVAWHAGNWTVNATSVGIAVEALPAAGGAGYTEAAYRSVASLVRWLADRTEVPLDRQHLLAAEEVAPAAADAGPRPGLGPSWDWTHLLGLAGAAPQPETWRADRVVTFVLPAAGSAPACTGPARCRRPGGVVRLRTEPRDDAQFLADPAAGAAGAGQRPAAAVTGQSFGVAGREGPWTAIWYGGRVGWFRDGDGALTVPGDGVLVGPTPGRASVPVFAQAGGVGGAAGRPARLADEIRAGQRYLLVEPVSVPVAAPRFAGPGATLRLAAPAAGDRFLKIRFDSRVAFVAAEDVQIAGLVG